MHSEKAKTNDSFFAELVPGVERGTFEMSKILGRYDVYCTRPKKGDVDEWQALIAEAALLYSLGRTVEAEMKEMQAHKLSTEIQWEDVIHNVITDVGVRHMLDNYLAGSAFTQTGPFMGLYSTASPSASDTMASHGTWLEVGTTNAPQFTGARKNLSGGWNAASSRSKAITSAQSFAITTSGTVKGAFLCAGSGAVSTILDTNGTLFSAGNFSGGDKSVVNTDTLNVSYTATLT